MTKKDVNSLVRVAVGGLLVVAGIWSTYWAKDNPEFITYTYGYISRKISGFLASVFAFFPFSLCEFALIGLILGVVASIFLLIFRWRKKTGWHGLLRWFSYLVIIGCGGFAFMMASWGLNYYALPLEETIDLHMETPTREDLYEAADYYLEQLNDTADTVKRSEDNICQLGSFEELAAQCDVGYKNLTVLYPRFRGGGYGPKKVYHWQLMSRTQITGIYCPFTGECNVNPDSAPASMPFTMMHEIAHRLAVCPENEANFVSLLACRESDIPEFQYSGTYSAFVYLYNAVSRVDDQKQSELWFGLDDGPLADVEAAILHYNMYEGKVSATAEKVNDTYLKAMNQTSGVESYGEVVDLIIADYKQNLK